MNIINNNTIPSNLCLRDLKKIIYVRYAHNFATTTCAMTAATVSRTFWDYAPSA